MGNESIPVMLRQINGFSGRSLSPEQAKKAIVGSVGGIPGDCKYFIVVSQARPCGIFPAEKFVGRVLSILWTTNTYELHF